MIRFLLNTLMHGKNSVNILNRRSDTEIKAYYDGVRSGLRMYANAAMAQRRTSHDAVSIDAMLALVEEMERAAFLPMQEQAQLTPVPAAPGA